MLVVSASPALILRDSIIVVVVVLMVGLVRDLSGIVVVRIYNRVVSLRVVEREILLVGKSLGHIH